MKWKNISVPSSFTVQKHPEHEKFYKNDPNFEQEFAEALPTTEPNVNNDVATPLTENHKENIIDQPIQSITVKTEMKTPKKSIAVKTEVTSPNNDIKREPKSTDPSNGDREFTVVRFTKIYDVRKKAMLNAVQQKEREQRMFHSKPAPNFQAIHAAVERKRQQQAPKVTCPITPIVMRRHAEKQAQLQKQVSAIPA